MHLVSSLPLLLLVSLLASLVPPVVVGVSLVRQQVWVLFSLSRQVLVEEVMLSLLRLARVLLS